VSIRLPIRERLHDQLDMVAIMGPFSRTNIDAVPAAINAHLATRVGASLLREPRKRNAAGTVMSWKRSTLKRAEAVTDRITRYPDLSEAELTMRVFDAGYTDIPMAVAESRGLLVFMFPHDLFDGVGAWEHITPILNAVVGLPVAETPPPTLQRPVLAALRHSKLTNRAALGAARAARRESERSTETSPQFPQGVGTSREKRVAGFNLIYLTKEELERVASTTSPRHPATGRATRSMKFAELVMDAWSDSISPELDFRIRLSVELRRYAPRGFRVEGPFSTGVAVGTLRGTDNSAGALRERLAALTTAKVPLAALVGDMVGLTKYELTHPLRRPNTATTRTSLDLGISILPSEIPEAMWDNTTERLSAVALIHPVQPSIPFVQVIELSDRGVLTVWDETGTVDLDAFRASIAAGIADRIEKPTREAAA
jgi:hypothetical protein